MYTICHNLLLAKLRAYGVGEKGIDFLYSYLSGRKQRVKVNGVFVGLATSVLWGHACLMYLSTIWIFLFNSLPWGSMLMILHASNTDISALELSLNKDLKNLSSRFASNYLSVWPSPFCFLRLPSHAFPDIRSVGRFEKKTKKKKSQEVSE